MCKPALVVAGLCLALAACGGGKRAAQPPTRSEFAAAANRICTQATTRTGRVARLRALNPPEADKNLYLHWMAAEKRILAALEDLARPADETETEPQGDPLIPLTIAEGKAAGYARRLEAGACVTMPG